MVRSGAPTQEMRAMADEDIFFLRLQLLVIMAKGYLKGYPVGERRRSAISENARLVFYQSLHHSNRCIAFDTDKKEQSDDLFSHFFCQRVQLLAVMATSFASGHHLEGFRLQALADNVDHISRYLTEQLHLSDVPFLRVA